MFFSNPINTLVKIVVFVPFVLVAVTFLFGPICLADQNRKKSNAWFNTALQGSTYNKASSNDYDVNRRMLHPTKNAEYISIGQRLARQLAEGNKVGTVNEIIKIAKDNAVGEINNSTANGPEWLSRIEFGFEYETDSDPVYSVTSVQPLYQSPGKINTFFTQLRYARHKQFDESRDTTNIGLGYRELVSDKTLLLGANVHFDREWERRHNRLGIGIEARWSGADLFLNRYQGLSNKKSISSTKTEEILDGWDLQALVQMPYVPSARISLVGSHWRKSSSEHISGIKAGVEADLSSSLKLEVGAANDNDGNELEVFAGIRFSIAGFGNNKNYFLDKNFVSDSPWQMRDMSEHTLDKIRRENNIRLKRSTTTGGSVTVQVARS